MACVLKAKSTAFVSKRLSEKFGKLWLAAEVILFVLVGAAVDIRYTLEAGLSAVLMIFVALLFRTVGVLLCTFKTTLTAKERAFCVIAYLPESHCPGRHRLRSTCCRTAMRQNRAVRCRYGHYYYGTAGGTGNGYDV